MRKLKPPYDSRIVLSDKEPWENDPCFENRLGQTIDRIAKMIRSMWVSMPLVLLVCLGLVWMHQLDRSRKTDLIISCIGSLMMTYVGLIVTVYWNLDSVYGRKWTLFMERYYEIFAREDDVQRELELAQLYQDMMTSSFWGDPSFGAVICKTVVHAIERTEKLGMHRGAAKAQLSMGSLKWQQVYDILSAYSSQLSEVEQNRREQNLSQDVENRRLWEKNVESLDVIAEASISIAKYCTSIQYEEDSQAV